MSFEVKVFVSPAAAIRQRRTVFGSTKVTVNDADLAAARDEVLGELGRAVASNNTIGADEGDPEIAEPTIDEVFRVLAFRAVRRAETQAQDAAARQAQEAETLREQERKAVEKREHEAWLAKQLKAIQQWVKTQGSESQRQRLVENVLPFDEIIEDITEHLCSDLTIDQTHARYEKLDADAACQCACADHVEFTVEPATSLSEAQFDALKTTREEAGTASALLHRAKCPSCDCVAVERLSIKVEMQWQGVAITREYAI